jgi:predicted RNase H-like HicB family nuclease
MVGRHREEVMMGCVDDGRLRAYLDAEDERTEHDVIAAHLAACPSCAAQVKTLRVAAAQAARALAAWLPVRTEMGVPEPDERRAGAALARFQATVQEQERAASRAPQGVFVQFKEQVTQMFDRLRAPRLRPVLLAVTALVILGLFATFTPVSSLADQLFKTFRVQQFAAVTVRVPAMKELPQAQQITPEQQQQIMQLLAPLGTLQTDATKDTFAQVTDTAAAQAFLAQYDATLQVPGQLPTAFKDQTPQYGTAKPTSSSYTLNVDVAKQYLAMANQPELNSLPWPDGVTQLTFGLDTPAAVATFYGDKEQGFGILQMANLPNADAGAGPALKLPAELDVNAFRAALLALPGLPQDTVNQLKNVKDWDRTLIIPVPEDATTKNVTINGNAGLLILDGQGRGSLLLWQANGNLYAVGGTLSEADVTLVAENLK